MPLWGDPEGDLVDKALPPVIDAHVHLFPDRLFEAIWDWFDRYAWPVRYRLTADRIVEFLVSRGVELVVGLHYAHVPGIAGGLNRYMADLCRRHKELVGTATVFPGEENARDLLEEAFDLGLVAVKLHAHVQCYEMDGKGMHEIYEVCSKNGKPLIMHAGREPKSPVFPYPRDPHVICGADKVETVLRMYPQLRVCVPHLGADECEEYRLLLETYDNLWLDIAMTQADYLPWEQPPPGLDAYRPDRVMYGTDFPHIPYAWDRELKRIADSGLSDESLGAILSGNARDFLFPEP